MAAPRLISSVEVWDHGRSARIAIPDVSPTTYDLYPYVADQGLEISETLGDFGREVRNAKITFVGPGAPPVVANPVYLSNRRVLRLHFDDATFEELRILRFNRELSGQSAPSIELEPIWMDLSTQIATRTASNKVIPTIYMIGRTAQSILDELGDYFPSHFQAGSAGTYASTVVSLVSVADNPLKLLRDLCAAVSEAAGGVCEWDYSWNAVDSKYDIDLTDGIGGTLAHPIEFGWKDANNRVQLQKTEDFGEYFSRVIPLGGPDEEIGTIAEATWSVSGASYDGGTGRTTLTLPNDPIYVDGSPGTSGIEFGNATQGYFTVFSTTAPGTLVVTGDASALNGNTGKFRLTTGDDLIYISDPSAETAAGQVERPERRSEVAPVENLLVAAGVTPDLDDWTAGMPDGTQVVGTPTISQTTTAEYVQSGTSSADVQADADEGIRTGNISLSPTDTSPYFSAWFGIRIVTGTIRMELIGFDGESYPLGKIATGEGNTFQGLLIGGLKPPSGNAYLQITALVTSTRFVLDSWTLTQTATAYAWTETMGANALWHIGGALLATKGGIQPNRFQGEWFDYAWILPGSVDEAEIGGKCQIKDAEVGGVYGVDVEVRLVELTRQYGGKNFVRKGRFGHRARDFTDFLFGGNRRRSLPEGEGTVTSNKIRNCTVEWVPTGTADPFLGQAVHNLLLSFQLEEAAVSATIKVALTNGRLPVSYPEYTYTVTPSGSYAAYIQTEGGDTKNFTVWESAIEITITPYDGAGATGNAGLPVTPAVTDPTTSGTGTSATNGVNTHKADTLLITGNLSLGNSGGRPHVGMFFDAEAHGAVGDGSTDDYAALTAALTAANAAGGGAVQLVSGKTYKLNTGLSIPANCGLQSVGQEVATLKAGANSITLLSGAGGGGWFVRNMILDGDSRRSGVRGLYLGTNQSRGHFENIFGLNIAGSLIELDEVFDCHFKSIHASDCGAASDPVIHIHSTSGTSNMNFFYGVQIQGGYGDQIEIDAYSFNNIFVGGHCEWFSGDGNAQTFKNIDCAGYRNKFYGFHVSQGSYAYDISGPRNELHGCMSVESGTLGLYVHGALADFCKVFGGAFDGWKIQDGEGIELHGVDSFVTTRECWVHGPKAKVFGGRVSGPASGYALWIGAANDAVISGVDVTAQANQVPVFVGAAYRVVVGMCHIHGSGSPTRYIDATAAYDSMFANNILDGATPSVEDIGAGTNGTQPNNMSV